MNIKSDIGETIRVSSDVFNEIFQELNKKYYNSSTKGWIKVEEMDERHICNAITYHLREWTRKLESQKHDPKAFVRVLNSEYPEIKSLVEELNSRLKEDESNPF